MLYILDLDRNTLITGAGQPSPIGSISGKRSRNGVIAVQIVQDNEAITSAIGGQFDLRFEAKSYGEFDQDPPLALADTFTWDSTRKLYTAPVDWGTDDLNDEFMIDGDPANDKDHVDLDAFIGHKFNTVDDWTEQENRVKLTLQNNGIRDDETPPVALPSSYERFVAVDRVQTFSGGEKTQARSNIGAADDAAVVKLTGTQTIAGAKTFSTAPVVPNGSASGEAVNKSQLDAAVVGLFDHKGNFSGSGDPNYPAASKGDVYRISVAGKVGGGSGKVVEVGDFMVALADNAGGTEGSVGTSWEVWQANLTGISAAGLAMLQAADATAQAAILAAFFATPAQGALADAIAATNPYGAPITLAYAGGLSPDALDGLYRKVALTGDATLNPPSNGVDGMKWKCRFTADSSPRQLTVDAAIKVPSASTFSGIVSIAADNTWIIQLEFNGSYWMLQTLIGSYP